MINTPRPPHRRIGEDDKLLPGPRSGAQHPFFKKIVKTPLPQRK